MAEQAHQVDRSNYISTYKSISGWKAIEYWWNETGEHGLPGFWEPWETGIGYYKTEAEATQEAKDWANGEGIRYVERSGQNG